jgi:hypothetical protein
VVAVVVVLMSRSDGGGRVLKCIGGRGGVSDGVQL